MLQVCQTVDASCPPPQSPRPQPTCTGCYADTCPCTPARRQSLVTPSPNTVLNTRTAVVMIRAALSRATGWRTMVCRHDTHTSACSSRGKHSLHHCTGRLDPLTPPLSCFVWCTMAPAWSRTVPSCVQSRCGRRHDQRSPCRCSQAQTGDAVVKGCRPEWPVHGISHSNH